MASHLLPLITAPALAQPSTRNDTRATSNESGRDAGNTGDGIGLPAFISGDPRFYGFSAIVRFGGVR